MVTGAGRIYFHYLDHVRAGGETAVAALRGTMRSIQASLLEILKGPVPDEDTAIMLLDSFRFE